MVASVSRVYATGVSLYSKIGFSSERFGSQIPNDSWFSSLSPLYNLLLYHRA
jgi:hypothetical protein